MRNEKIQVHFTLEQGHRAARPRDERHRCYYGSSGRCPCGLHRDPERAVHVAPMSSDRERLSVEL